MPLPSQPVARKPATAAAGPVPQGGGGCARKGRRVLLVLQFAVLAAGLVALWLFSDEVRRWLVWIFREPREDMGHGWFVPLFSLALVWMKRRELWRSLGGPSAVGALLALPGMALFWIGARGEQVRLCQIAALWILWCLPYACFGRKTARLLAFPVLFLGFTVPLAFLDIFTMHLRRGITFAASWLLNGVNIPVVQSGTGLRCLAGEGFSLDVADPCSGLRSIYALAALTAAYAYLTQKSLLKRWILFSCALPLAVFGNFVRILGIAVVARFCGQKAALGFYHDFSGYITFLVAILLMMAVGKWISGWRLGRFGAAGKTPDRAAQERDQPAATGSAVPSLRPAFLLACVLAVALPVGLEAERRAARTLPPPELDPVDFLADELPELEGYRSAVPWHCQNEQCGRIEERPVGDAGPSPCPACGTEMSRWSLAEKTILPSDTILRKRYYYDPMGDVYRVTLVVNGRSRRSIHRPEGCLPAHGFSMENAHVERFLLDDGATIDVNCTDLRRQFETTDWRLGQGYFFVSPRLQTARHLTRILTSVRDRALRNRITRWGMVSVFCEESLTHTPERLETVRRFLSRFYPGLFRDGGASPVANGTEADP